MRMKIFALGLILLTLLINGSAAAQQKFEPTIASMRQAIARGQAKEFLAAMEAMGSEAERKELWPEASMAYNRASVVAARVGQLQKSIPHGAKALELAQKAKDPYLQTLAMRIVARAYKNLGQFEKEREWLQKGLEASKQITDGRKEFQLASSYGELGENFLNQREGQKAIEYISYSVQAYDSLVNDLKYRARRKNPRAIEQAESNMVGGLNRLGTAHLRAGNAQEAIKAFERGLAIVKTTRLDAPAEGDLFVGLGQAWLAQKDFPRALENFSKALQMGEGRRQTALIQQASGGIGSLFLQTQRRPRRFRIIRKP